MLFGEEKVLICGIRRMLASDIPDKYTKHLLIIETALTVLLILFVPNSLNMSVVELYQKMRCADSILGYSLGAVQEVGPLLAGGKGKRAPKQPSTLRPKLAQKWENMKSYSTGEQSFKEVYAHRVEMHKGKGWTEASIVVPGNKGTHGSSSIRGPTGQDFRPKHQLKEHQFRSDIFDKQVQWTAPTGTQQTYKVYQRNDINWDLVRTSGLKDFRGKTNREAALAGYSPQLADGNLVTIHHINQSSKGALVEASTKHHGFKSKDHQKIHSIWGKEETTGRWKKHPDNPVDHNTWKKEQKEYWKYRVDQ